MMACERRTEDVKIPGTTFIKGDFTDDQVRARVSTQRFFDPRLTLF